MDGTSFVGELKNGPEMNPEENVFKSIWAEYERVILQSLITSFGLDFIVRDQHGGDVDTIHNVREIGIDEQMQYKNSVNATSYENRGEYDTKAYLRGENLMYPPDLMAAKIETEGDRIKKYNVMFVLPEDLDEADAGDAQNK